MTVPRPEPLGLGQLEYLSLVSKICSELETQLGVGDKVLAKFIIDLGRDCETESELDEKLKENGAEFPDYFVRTLLTIIKAILGPMKGKGERERDRDGERGRESNKVRVRVRERNGDDNYGGGENRGGRDRGDDGECERRKRHRDSEYVRREKHRRIDEGGYNRRDVDQDTGKDLLPLKKHPQDRPAFLGLE